MGVGWRFGVEAGKGGGRGGVGGGGGSTSPHDPANRLISKVENTYSLAQTSRNDGPIQIFDTNLGGGRSRLSSILILVYLVLSRGVRVYRRPSPS